MGADSDWNVYDRNFPLPNCVPFSRDRTRALDGDGYGYPFSLTSCRNSYDHGYCYSVSCSGNSFSYNHRDPLSCCWNSYGYGYPYSVSCCRNSHCECNRDPHPCCWNSYGYDYGYPFSCSSDPQHYQYTFTHCNREPDRRCIAVANTDGHLDVYPDSISYGSGVSDSFLNSSVVNHSFSVSSVIGDSLVHCSGDRDADADRFQYSRPDCVSDGNPVRNKHSLEQSPVSGCICRQYRFQQYRYHRRFRNGGCSVGCRSNCSRFLPYGQPSSPYRISSSLPNSSNNHEYSSCLLPGRCGGGSSYHDGSPTHVFGSAYQ